MKPDTTRRAMLGALAVAPVAGLPAMAATSPSLAALIEAHKEAAGHFHRIIDEDDGSFGKEWDEASAAEEAAALALCRYRCASMDEARVKANYILNAPTILQDIDDAPGYARAFIAALAAVVPADSEA